MKPDYLVIPMIVYEHENLRPTDKILYAIIYWYEKMKDGKCYASNETIAIVSGVDLRTVKVGLERLEKAGFIKRIYEKNGERVERKEIKCLVHYAKVKADDEPQQQGISLPAVREDTPGEYARKFFAGDKEIIAEIAGQLEQAGASKELVVRELLKFKNYWTEPTKSGKRVRWELQGTFDVKRRLGTWFRNIAERGAKGGNRAGHGVTV